ncbi:MAG: cytochrome c oxidase subunit 3 [Verrucomicrobiia bacterium]|jgi:heme/copper-type cytochrome/quinol oxidase subunit 3
MSGAIEIPYNSTERPDTGLYNAKLGVWLFLSSEVMLFGALFSTYVLLRTGSETWEHGAEFLNVPLATINTLVLIISSVTMVMSWASLKAKEFGKYKLYMGLTILCGAAFLVIKGFEYAHKFETGLFPSTSTFMALYFTMTGLHGLHVIGGMIVNSYLWGPGSRMWQTDPQRFTNRIEVAGLYWHFVDLVWIFLFPTLYLLPGK